MEVEDGVDLSPEEASAVEEGLEEEVDEGLES